ncbi:MAG: sugar transferase [Patescibacteria group bacterium]
MSILNRKEYLILGIGDILIFFFALWLMLFVRYGAGLDKDIFYAHLSPFSLLIIAWLVVFFVAGLYEKHTLLLRSRLPNIVLKSAIVNSFLAVIFFYFIPYFGIAPKVNLFLYLLFSSVFILFWRMYGYRFFYTRKKQDAISIGTGVELAELTKEVNQNERYNIRFVDSFDIGSVNPLEFKKIVSARIENDQVALIAADFKNKKIEPLLPYLYDLIFKNVEFVDIHVLYEEIFDRIPISLINYDWFLEYVSVGTSASYDGLKRLMDIVISIPLLIIPVLTYPFVFIAMKLEDGRPVFSSQTRVGKNNHKVRLLKFRTMSFNDDGDWKGLGKVNKVTKVGAFLRKTRLDEFPQLWNVLRGDISLIGPRPEFPEPVQHYVEEIPYYNTRHLIKPGLSGWAQLYHENHPHHEADVNETRVKLSYDLYYIKNRSFFLDLKIALKTMKTLLSRSGV